jgi:hypothetical protein
MENLSSVNCQLALLYNKITVFISHHFTVQFFYGIVIEGIIVNCLKNSGNPTPSEMATRSITSPMFSKPSGYMMAGRTNNPPSLRPHLLEVNNTQPAILKNCRSKLLF